MNSIYTIKEIRDHILNKFLEGDFVVDKTGAKTIEILNASFVVDEDIIFGNINKDWANREIAWYETQSLSVYDIPEPIPLIWKQVASSKGLINSNYGWCVFSEENGNQFENCKNQLINDIDSRRAVLIYTRPSIQDEYNTDGMSDFICTNNTQFLIRDNKLHHLVYMRSNDVVHGFKGDAYWQKYVHDKMLSELREHYPNLTKGDLIWNAGSLHVYERHFFMIDGYNKTGNYSITKKEYDVL